MINYGDLLKDPRWQRKRLEILERDEWTCRLCGCSTEQLHVHHTRYISGCKPWEYPSELMKTVCHTCHTKEHSRIDPDKFLESSNEPVPVGVEIIRFFKERFGVEEEMTDVPTP